MPDVLAQMDSKALGRIVVGHDLSGSIDSNTDVVYTDCWPKIGEPSEIKAAFLPYQVDGLLLERMNPKGFFLPCPPVTRGQEVSTDAMNSPLCLDYAAKEFLLYTQNAIMEFLVKRN